MINVDKPMEIKLWNQPGPDRWVPCSVVHTMNGNEHILVYAGREGKDREYIWKESINPDPHWLRNTKEKRKVNVVLYTNKGVSQNLFTKVIKTGTREDFQRMFPYRKIVEWREVEYEVDG